MAERQEHGFRFENLCDSMLSNMELYDGYTNIDDAVFDTGNRRVRVSIKSINHTGEICLGDIFRIVEIDEPLLMLVGNHFRGKEPDTIDAYYFENGFPGIMHGNAKDVASLCHEFYDYMLSEENLNERNYDKHWTEERKRFLDAYKALFGTEGGGDAKIFIHPRPKRDHKNQRRIQCAIPRRYRGELDSMYRIATFDRDRYEVKSVAGIAGTYPSEEEAWDAFAEAICRAVG